MRLHFAMKYACCSLFAEWHHGNDSENEQPMVNCAMSTCYFLHRKQRWWAPKMSIKHQKIPALSLFQNFKKLPNCYSESSLVGMNQSKNVFKNLFKKLLQWLQAFTLKYNPSESSTKYQNRMLSGGLSNWVKQGRSESALRDSQNQNQVFCSDYLVLPGRTISVHWTAKNRLLPRIWWAFALVWTWNAAVLYLSLR